MDLTGNTQIVTRWSLNTDTDIYTLDFYKVVGLSEVFLGNVLLEHSKFRSMLNALDEISRALMPDLEPRQTHRTVFDDQAGKGTTDFNP